MGPVSSSHNQHHHQLELSNTNIDVHQILISIHNIWFLRLTLNCSPGLKRQCTSLISLQSQQFTSSEELWREADLLNILLFISRNVTNVECFFAPSLRWLVRPNLTFTSQFPSRPAICLPIPTSSSSSGVIEHGARGLGMLEDWYSVTSDSD